MIHGHQGTADADRFSWISRPFVKGYRYVEPVFNIFEAPSAPTSPIISSFERSRYMWASKNNVIIICGHTHRAVFGSMSKADVLRIEILKLRDKLEHTDSLSLRKKILLDISRKKYDLGKEKFLGRSFDSLGDNPLPCYFNTGCGLYKDGLTLLEIDNDKLRLVKWNRNTSHVTSRIYGETSLTKCIEEIETRSESNTVR